VASAVPPVAVEMPPAKMEEPKSEPAPMPVAEMPQPPKVESNVSPAVAALQSNPRVMMQAVPKDDLAGPRTPAARSAVQKPVAPPAKTPVAEKRVASAETPAARPSAEKRVLIAGSGGSYYVQAGAFATVERADQIAQSLDSMGARVTPATVDGRAVYRVRIGPFLDVRQANAAMNQAQALGHQDLRLVAE